MKYFTVSKKSSAFHEIKDYSPLINSAPLWNGKTLKWCRAGRRIRDRNMSDQELKVKPWWRVKGLYYILLYVYTFGISIMKDVKVKKKKKVCHRILAISLWSKYYYPNFLDKKTKAPRSSLVKFPQTISGRTGIWT